MSAREAIKAAVAEVKAGKDRRQVFEAYQSHMSRPVQLATAIAGVAREEAKAKEKGLNTVLVVLLVVAGLLKVLGAFVLLSGQGVLLTLGVAVLSVVVPFAFAYEVNRFNGALYGMLVILCGVGMLNALVRFQGSVIATGLDVVLLGGVMALTLTLKKRLFPALGFLGARKDPQGQFFLG